MVDRVLSPRGITLFMPATTRGVPPRGTYGGEQTLRTRPTAKDPPVFSEKHGRTVVYARSQGRCECCTRAAAEWHHRQNRSQGGTWAPSNGLHLCKFCHIYVTEQRTHALALGLALSSGADPTTAPAYVHPTGFWRGWWVLDDEGCLTWDHDRSMHPTPPPDVARAVLALTAARLLL